MRKIVMSGLVAGAALLGCAGPALAAAGPATVARPATAATAAKTAENAALQAIAVRYPAGSAARRIVASYLGRPSMGRQQGSSGSILSFGTGLSCASPTACLSIGTDFDAKASSLAQGLKPAAERLHAGTWKSVPVNAPKGSQYTQLTGVSCKAATYCLVVGGSFAKSASGGESPAAWTWNGTTLTPIAAPPVPKADVSGGVTSVSCVAVRRCVAIGTGTNKTTSDVVQFIWALKGTRWALTTVPAANARTDTEYASLHCFSLRSCVAIGDSVNLASGADIPAAASWNGTAFTDLKAPQPTGTSGAAFNDLSCVSAHSCAVVGEADTGSTGIKTLGFAEVWNGKTWKVTKWGGPKGDTEVALFGVSCTSAVRCIAVGAHGTAKTGAPAALAWTGSKWTLLKMPGAGPGKAAIFISVSCPVNGKCVAAGAGGKTNTANPVAAPIAGYWNGRVWKYGPMFAAA